MRELLMNRVDIEKVAIPELIYGAEYMRERANWLRAHHHYGAAWAIEGLALVFEAELDDRPEKVLANKKARDRLAEKTEEVTA